jgi:hypothetical protein
MSVKTQFPFFFWTIKTLTGVGARRTYASILFLVLCLTTTARLRSYFMARKINAVLHGLAEIRVDQTTEDELTRAVPYLRRSEPDWKAGNLVQHLYHAEISNESDWLMPRIIGYGSWAGQVAYWIGDRYMSFDVSVLARDGKVSRVQYGLAKQAGQPRQLSYIVAAESVHGYWAPNQHGFEVTTQDDESPQYRPVLSQIPTWWGHDVALRVTFTNDAPEEITRRVFQLSLSCFWSLRGCNNASEIAPQVWQDARAIQVAAHERMLSGKCPDSLIQGRMRYLPDVSVLLLQVKGSRRVEVNQGEYTTEDWFTDYDLKEVIRGRSFGSWTNVRFQQMIPSPEDPTRTMANQVWPPTKIGTQVLFFGNLDFDSCRFIPATASALDIVRKAPVALERPEDEIRKGLM